MKESQAWSERVTFVECPECDHSHNLGDTQFDDDETVWTCEKCKVQFIVIAESKR